MVVIFNESLEIGSWITSATNNLTGDIATSLLILLLLLIMIAMLFKTPMILFLVLIFPVLIVFSQYDTSGMFWTLLIIVACILGFFIAKGFFAYK